MVNQLLLDVILIGFLLTQSGYFLVNFLSALLVFPRHVEVIREPSTEQTPLVNVLIPIYHERKAVVTNTLEELATIDYPNDSINVYLVYEPDDEVVMEYIDELQGGMGMNGLSFTKVAVDKESLGWHEARVDWSMWSDLPHTKAAALNYAFYTLTFPGDSIVTVFDSDTIVPPDTFRLAVTGLEDHEIVQAKQTVRNFTDGWLPYLEAIGMAAWSHLVYAKTTDGPYQLLGKGYFVRVRDLYALDAWDTTAVTEDMSLGVAADQAGYSLAVLDRYVQDLCPAGFEEWTNQKTRWVGGPYRILTARSLSWGDEVRFGSFTLSNQFLCLVNVFGIPFGILGLLLQATGEITLSNVFGVIVLFNFVTWMYYSLRSYEAAAAAIQFDSRRERLVYFVVVNPLTQAVYAALWVVPIGLALLRSVRHEEQEFEVTPK